MNCNNYHPQELFKAFFRNGCITMLIAGAVVCMLTACERELMTEEAPISEAASDTTTTGKKNVGQLTIVTRAAGDQETVSYPVMVYVLNRNGKCVYTQTINQSEESVSTQLTSGTYQVLAIAGATGDKYALPSQDDVTAESVITLKEGSQHADLMTASGQVKIGRNLQNTLTLSFERKVMQIGQITLSDIPAEATDVSVELWPLYGSLQLNGEYSDEDATGSAEIKLTRQADGTWQHINGPFLLPSSGKASLTVNMTLGGVTSSYTFNTNLTLQANSRINITGNYTGDAGMFALSAVFTGAVWGEDTDITFSFGESGSQGDDGNNNDDGNNSSDTAPAKGTWYKDCYVFLSETNGNSTTVTLVHKNEIDIDATGKTEAEVKAEIEASLPSFNINGITGWRLPNETEAAQFPSVAMATSEVAEHGGTPMNNSEHYYYETSNNLFAFMQVGFSNNLGRSYTYGQHFRPVTTITFNK